MEFSINTYDIQHIVIALIMYKTDDVITKEDIRRLTDKLSEINNLCTEQNNYTLNIKID